MFNSIINFILCYILKNLYSSNNGLTVISATTIGYLCIFNIDKNLRATNMLFEIKMNYTLGCCNDQSFLLCTELKFAFT